MSVEGVNWPKVIALLVLTIGGMRLFGSAVRWAARRTLRLGPRASAVAGNGIALAAFVAWLFLDLEKGEPMDWAAVGFAAVVFGSFLALDLLWPRRGTPPV